MRAPARLAALGTALTAFLLVAAALTAALPVAFSAVVGLPVGLAVGLVVGLLLWTRFDRLSAPGRRAVVGAAGFGYTVLALSGARYVDLPGARGTLTTGRVAALAVAGGVVAALVHRRVTG
jgi:hypothetical protein